ncbi:hypothetical protein [Parasitella parasitica]|uniref:Uncharacterized protein n=1 Tax=Parasitella parasitica TaxID=35722 RepID=A0A0B7NHG7_9FUNG|nr:hypothetical protein [Parasitella parasitica]
MPGSTRVNAPASLTTSATSTRSKATTENDESYMDALRLQFEHRIVKSTTDMKQLLRGVVCGAEQVIDAPVNSIVVFLNRLTRNTQKKSIELWKEYLDKNFASLKDSIVTQEAEGNQEMMEEDEEETADDEKAEEKNGKIQIVPREVQSLASLLPANYLEDKDVFVPKPLDRQFLQNDVFKEDFDALFHEAHFNQIHSTYFGPKGISKSTLNAAGLSSHVMKMARNVYVTNFANMWADNTIVNRALNRLLETLLNVHLSPARDQKFQKKREELKGRRKGKSREPPNDNCAVPVHSMSLINKTYNGRRRLFAKEIDRRNYYIMQRSEWAVKHWRASLCQQRLNSYANVLQREKEEREARREHEHQQEDVLSEDVSTEYVSVEEDAPRKKIYRLMQLTKSALFEDKDITVEYLADKMGDINDKETNAILKIIIFVKPYMASRETYHQFSQQVPILFMTNQVLHSLGYLNRVVKFTPVIKLTSLHALWVDPTTLYSLFCARKLERKMVLYNFEGNIIRAASVTSQKDAIFSSFFDIDRLKTVCAGSGLQFAHRIHILPGLQCVRILGVRDYQQPKN